MNKKKNIITLPLNANVIEVVSDYLLSFNNNSVDFSKIAIIFGGKRPSLFLARELRNKIKKPFFPPQFFSMDDFIEFVISRHYNYGTLNIFDAYYLIYEIVQESNFNILSNYSNFKKFLPWAKEIFAFIEELNLEMIEDKKLLSIEKSAEIGYDIPENMNLLLERISAIRNSLHQKMEQINKLSRGRKYLLAKELCCKTDFSEFEKIIFVNPFYLHNTEIETIKTIKEKFEEKLTIFFCGSGSWKTLSETAKKLDISLSSENYTQNLTEPNIIFYCGFNTQSQTAIIREIIKKIPTEKLGSTVIVLPKEDAILPLLTEISPLVRDFNISLGYSLTHTPLFSLLASIFEAQITKKENKYYSENYLNVITNPIVRSYSLEEKLDNEAEITLIVTSKIEEILRGNIPTPISGFSNIELHQIENLTELYSEIISSPNIAKVNIQKETLSKLIKNIHNLFFYRWEDVSSIEDFVSQINNLINEIMKINQFAQKYINVQSAKVILSICDEIKNSLINKKNLFNTEELYTFFLEILSEQKIAFKGSPLKGLQTLGFLETRNLNFENVIMMDLNESIFPKIKVYEQLIPREIMISLGINRLEKEEEIQKYNFYRLIKSAKNVFLIYSKNEEFERSRFIEEILWEENKKRNDLILDNLFTASFNTNFFQSPHIIKKDNKIISYLSELSFSPSSIDTYLRCPLQFYYRYVLKLSENNNLLEDIEHSEIGTFIHKLLEEFFAPYCEKEIKLDSSIRITLFSLFEKKFKKDLQQRMQSDYYLLEEVLKFWLKNFMDYELKRLKEEVKKIIYLEKIFLFSKNLDNYNVKFKVKIDRIDLLNNGELLILDYKTGSAGKPSLNSLGEITSTQLSRQIIKEKIKSFQLPLYLEALSKNIQKNDILLDAAFYFIREKKDKIDYFLKEYLTEERLKILEKIDLCLEFIIKEIINPEIPFISCKEDKEPSCKTCPFTYLCT